MPLSLDGSYTPPPSSRAGTARKDLSTRELTLWDWLIKRETKRGALLDVHGSDTAYRTAVLGAERSSAVKGWCKSGHFDRASERCNELPLRRALDFFMGSFAMDSSPDSWVINRSLLAYLRGVSPVPFVLTAGWYEFGGRRKLEHAQGVAEQAIMADDATPQRRAVHTWLTSRAFEIIDITMPGLLDPAIWHTNDRSLAFYFKSPSARDLVIYHPTAIIEDDWLQPVANQHGGGSRRVEQIRSEGDRSA